jgi:hypothetical protein
MASVSSRLVFLLFTICAFIADLAIASRFKCSEKDGNNTKNSAYEENLSSLLSSLSTNITGIGNRFYNSSSGKNPDRVFEIALCRGDLKSGVCRSCFNFSTYFLRQRCPNHKGASMLRTQAATYQAPWKILLNFVSRATITCQAMQMLSTSLRRSGTCCKMLRECVTDLVTRVETGKEARSCFLFFPIFAN